MFFTLAIKSLNCLTEELIYSEKKIFYCKNNVQVENLQIKMLIKLIRVKISIGYFLTLLFNFMLNRLNYIFLTIKLIDSQEF